MSALYAMLLIFSSNSGLLSFHVDPSGRTVAYCFTQYRTLIGPDFWYWA